METSSPSGINVPLWPRPMVTWGAMRKFGPTDQGRFSFSFYSDLAPQFKELFGRVHKNGLDVERATKMIRE